MTVKTQKFPLTGPFSWAKSKASLALSKSLGPENMRFVGGAVRDSLLGRAVLDIDVATPLAPKEVMKRLGKDKIKVVPTGLKHGTVTAIFGNQTFEITTLRHDVKTHGRHADVAFHGDWQADAKRRDFTINALYLGPEGTLYDYFDGRSDLEKGRIRFIGNAVERIREDGLRILRLFRFHAWYGQEALSDPSLAAVQECLDMIDKLSAERVQTEILKTLAAPDPGPEFRAMEKAGVMAKTFPGFDWDLGGLENLVGLENELQMVDPIRRLGALFKGQARTIASRLKLSNKVRDRLEAMARPGPEPLTERAVRAEVYWAGLEAVEDRLLLASHDAFKLKKPLKVARDFDVPKFPVTGKDLEGLGMSPGIDMGEKLKELEARWVESDFGLSKTDLLKN